MPKPDLHVLVCTNQRADGHPKGCCSGRGSVEIRNALRQAVALQPGLNVRVSKAGCLGPCELGPTVVVHPDGVWYGGVALEDVDLIVREHLVGGRPVESLQLNDEDV